MRLHVDTIITTSSIIEDSSTESIMDISVSLEIFRAKFGMEIDISHV